jgi:hypothetical protein
MSSTRNPPTGPVVKLAVDVTVGSEDFDLAAVSVRTSGYRYALIWCLIWCLDVVVVGDGTAV